MLASILVGLGTGIISSLMFLYFLTKVRPKISISENIAKDTLTIRGETLPCFRVKIVNKTWRSKIYDIEAQLFLLRFDATEGGHNIFMDKIPLLKEKVWSLNCINKNDQHAEFAYQFICTDDLDGMWKENNNIEIIVRARHAFSGFTKTVRKRYYIKSNAIKNGSFKFGNNMEIY
ncbi:MAG: hypothetical protein VYB44_07165 [Bacteroidota bacterium]|nr:hypothetical protein [Bacteroidota bacterium]